MAESARRRRGGAQGGDGRPNDHLLDRELDHLPPEARWREWMNRVEATIFAACAGCSTGWLNSAPSGTVRPPGLPHLWALTIMVEAARAKRGKGRSDDHRSGERQSADQLFDRELDHLPPEARWREWMNRVEATIFAASEPVGRETLARIVGNSCSIDLLIDDIRDELRGRPYDLVSVAGGWKHLTRPVYADAIRSAFGTAAGGSGRAADLTQSDVLG
ncbi:SMC-Scp complex subunit ScpB [Aquamicrobium defluvii]|uniref:SMC-Scp complex subunit ScpB n=1 Tax=Aquamicrobium defluvii TaxID=69279 RepID=UPI002477D0EC|nr:SMC-Scp complex subunit ScpB [Aquamicrobium defluvii]